MSDAVEEIESVATPLWKLLSIAGAIFVAGGTAFAIAQSFFGLPDEVAVLSEKLNEQEVLISKLKAEIDDRPVPAELKEDWDQKRVFVTYKNLHYKMQEVGLMDGDGRSDPDALPLVVRMTDLEERFQTFVRWGENLMIYDPKQSDVRITRFSNSGDDGIGRFVGARNELEGNNSTQTWALKKEEN
ncbi:MAG: hypothetical protein AAF340_05715 [Pseudomonadota bacterium]